MVPKIKKSFKITSGSYRKRTEKNQNESKKTYIKLSKTQWNTFKENIKKGTIQQPAVFKKIIKTVKKQIPRLAKIYKHKWFKILRREIKKPESKTPQSIKNIRKILKKHDAKLTLKKWNFIKKNIKIGNISKPNIFKLVLTTIKQVVPSLKKIFYRRRLAPNWFIYKKTSCSYKAWIQKNTT